MPNDGAATTASEILATMTREQLERVLAAAPHVVAALDGVGPIAGYFDNRAAHAPLTRERLAAHVAHVSARRLTVQQLPPVALQLLSVVLVLGGEVSTEDLVEETAGLTGDQLADLVDMLVDRLLLRRTARGVAIVAGVDTIVARTGRSVHSLALNQAATKDDIRQMLVAHGITHPPATKQERIDLLASLLSDREHMLGMRRRMSPDTRQSFDEIIEGGAGGVSARSVGLDPWIAQAYHRLPVRQFPPRMRALLDLDEIGVVWVEPMADRVAAWTEVIRSVRGRIDDVWVAPQQPTPVPLDSDGSELPPAFSVLHGLLDRVAAEPIAGLKSGGIGVKAIRDLAKRIGRAEPEVELLLWLAFALGAIQHHEEIVGKGRNASWVHRYAVDPVAAAALRGSGNAMLWRTLVASWSNGRDGSDDQFHRSVVRFQLLHDLLALAPGTGIPAEDFDAWVRTGHWVAASVDRTALLADLRGLGLVPATGAVGLTTLGRLLLTDPAEVDALLPDTVSSFVVQADHTVVAPPTLDPSLRSVLERLATVQSSGAATVYRLDPAKIGAHLAEGNTAESVVEFLATASTVALPPTVTRLLVDLERQRGGLTVRSAATIVTADDVIGLAAAVSVKAARLTLLAPTVAVSDLAPAKVTAALRAKGLAPSVEQDRLAISTATTARAASAAASGQVNGSAGVNGSAAGHVAGEVRQRPRPVVAGPEATRAVLDRITNARAAPRRPAKSNR